MKLSKNQIEAVKEFQERKKPLDDILWELSLNIHTSKEDRRKFLDTLEKRSTLAEEISRKYFLKLRWELEAITYYYLPELERD